MSERAIKITDCSTDKLTETNDSSVEVTYKILFFSFLHSEVSVIRSAGVESDASVNLQVNS